MGNEEGKPTLARSIHKHAARLFGWAIETRIFKPQLFPFAGSKPLFKDKKRTRYHDPDELRALYAGAGEMDTMDRAYFRLLLFLGCRRGELAPMRWDEIKPDHVKGQYLWYRDFSKNGDPQELPLPAAAMAILDELRRDQSGPFVFPAQRNPSKRANAANVTGHRSDSWKPVKRLQELSGVADFTNHDLL